MSELVNIPEHLWNSCNDERLLTLVLSELLLPTTSLFIAFGNDPAEQRASNELPPPPPPPPPVPATRRPKPGRSGDDPVIIHGARRGGGLDHGTSTEPDGGRSGSCSSVSQRR